MPKNVDAKPAVRGLQAASPEQHGVAVGVEPVLFAYRDPVRAEDALGAAERAHDGQEGRAGQVEVREQAVDDAQLVARLDEQARVARDGPDLTRAIGVGGALEGAHGRGADGDDRRPAHARPRDRRRRSTARPRIARSASDAGRGRRP